MADKNKIVESKTIEEKVITPQFVVLEIIDTDEHSAFVKIQDWRMRVYFEDKKISPINYNHRLLKIEYIGDINDVKTLQLLPIKA